MTVYVDGTFDWKPNDWKTARNGTRWCHLVADSVTELVEFAAMLGLKSSYLQRGGSGRWPHFDLTPSKRAKAVKLGAIEVTSKELLVKAKATRN